MGRNVTFAVCCTWENPCDHESCSPRGPPGRQDEDPTTTIDRGIILALMGLLTVQEKNYDTD